MLEWIKHTLAKDFKLKAFALLVALSFEYYFYSPENSLREVIPSIVVFSGLPSNSIITSPLYGATGIPAEVEVEGPLPLVRQLQQKILKIPYEVASNAIPGKINIKLEPTMVPVPSGVKVLRVSTNFKSARIDIIKESSNGG